MPVPPRRRVAPASVEPLHPAKEAQFYMKRLAAPAHNRTGIRVIRPAAVTAEKYPHRILREIGRNVPQEAPQTFAKAVLDVASSSS